MKGHKDIAFIIIMVLLLLPIIQVLYPVFNERPLKGAVIHPEEPEWSLASWRNGEFQRGFGDWYEYQIGLRSFLIRLRNQWYFSLFRESTTYVRLGKSSQFFSWDYWSTYKGYDNVSRDTVIARANKLAALRDTLEKQNKHLLCVIAPNKVRYMPEFLPDELDSSPGEHTYYDLYRQELLNHGIPLLDLNKYFLELKDTVLKPLFASTSIHWSGYGMHLGISEIIRSLEVLGQRSHEHMRYASWVMKDSVINSDRDMVDLMNILLEPPTEPLAFPEYVFEQHETDRRAKVLLIGDSFFWNFYSFDGRFQIFHPSTRFWYYNQTEYDVQGIMTSVSELSARETLKHVDYLVIMATESNLGKFPFGFTDKFVHEYP